MRVLVTGGIGYIGSHTCVELLLSGHEVLVVDNLNNSRKSAIDRIKKLTGRAPTFCEVDIREQSLLQEIFRDFNPAAVVHFAGLKSPNASILEPARYYSVNVGGTAAVLRAMENTGCEQIVFSSSAAVYGEPNYLPCDEQHPLQPITPYGRTKLIGEQLLNDWVAANSSRRAIALRYFNPVGAHSSGQIGEDPMHTPGNLMPFISQTAVGKRNCLKVYGKDYLTPDGTGIRDYVHVVDLAKAHVVSVSKMKDLSSFEIINIGTGNGISVLELVNEFQKQSGKKIKLEFVSRRLGDTAKVWADVSLAKQKLDFEAQYGIVEMCRDTWKWQKNSFND